jgi:arginase
MTATHLELIAAALGEGAADVRTAAGPGALRQWGLARRLRATGCPAYWANPVRAERALRAQGAMAVVTEFAPRLAQAVMSALARGHCPVVLGGDHSCAVGTWSGVATWLTQGAGAAAPPPALGLIWIDAHLDAHTPETSESQRPHGMPVAALLGHGLAGLTQVGMPQPKLRPEHVVLIGPRSYEPGEAALLQRLGVRIMWAHEVQQRGFAACLAEALARVRRGTAAWGLSFDLDALDPAEAPGTGTRVAQGLHLAEVAQALQGLAYDPHWVAAEIVEYNPRLDEQRRTAQAAWQLLAALWAHAPTARP